MGRSTVLSPDARALFAEGTVAGLSDEELLDRFARRLTGMSEVAFSALVARHGPMVLGVCRRILSNPHDVEDAFQATFLVLVRRAASVRVRDSLAPWLHGVSHRVATRAQVAASRRHARETPDVERLPAPAGNAAADADLRSVIDSELARLPKRYRSPVVLCDLEGLSHVEAARQLRCPLGTIKSRLTRGREQLRERLTRRGLAPSAGAFSSLLLSNPAILPGSLSRATVRAATSRAMGRWAMAGAFPASASALTEGVLRTMVWTKLKWTAATLLVGCSVGTVSVALRGALAADPPASTSPADSIPAKRRELPPPSPYRRAIEEALKKPISLNLSNEPLANALKLLSRECGTDIVVDPRALSDRVSLATPVSIAVNDLPIQTTLKLMLKPLWLKYKIEDDVVIVTSFLEPRLSVFVELRRQDDLSARATLRLHEELIKDIEQRTPYKVVPYEEADLIVTPTPKLQAQLDQLVRNHD